MSAHLNFDSLRAEYSDVLKQCLKTKTTNLIQMKEKSFSKTDLDLKAPLDQAFRDLLLEYLDKEESVSDLKELVEFCMQTCREGYTTPTVPVILLADIFDALTLDVCQEMFTFVEENVNIWKEDLFFSGCKNHLLRLCNNLLKRLSRSTATVFCGRILLFLAKFFPFSERSGLNIVSEFNLENVTEYGADASQETITEIEVGDSKKPLVIDFTLYCKFWSLQDFFRSPNQCYSKAQWKLFCNHATAILNTFEGLKLDYVAKSVSNINSERESTMYFSKYLTSQKLFDLQLYDVNFRRSVLLQFLILFQYLTSSVKFKSESFDLKAEHKEWITLMTEKIYTLLKETPPDGATFAAIVSKILTREEHWNAWKNEGCPEFKKQSSSVETTEKTRTETPLLGDLIKQASKEGKYYMGNSELTKLWNYCPDNLEACKDRDFLPSLDTYFQGAIEQLESNTPVRDEDNLFKDGNFGWRALRLLARRSPHFFMYTTTITNPMSLYLETMVKRIAHDSPGRAQESSQEVQNENELEVNLFKGTEEEQANEEMKQAEGEEFNDDSSQRNDNKTITILQLQLISEKVAPDWKKLAVKLGFKKDEIEFFENENHTPITQARHMLRVWLEDDEDATLENFVYILEGLGMNDAAEVVKHELSSADH